MGRTAKDISGKIFGYITVISREHSECKKNAKWLCECHCGKKFVTEGNRLRGGKVNSCGCMRGQLKIATMGTHGKTNSRLYKIWRSMKSRCSYSSKGAERYHGRGIKVCDDWSNSFDEFMDWSLVNGYSDDLSIDRIDPDGHYCPENCRWATLEVQNNNKASNFFVDIDGEKKTIAEWSKFSGIKYETIRSRISRGITGKRLLQKLHRGVRGVK